METQKWYQICARFNLPDIRPRKDNHGKKESSDLRSNPKPDGFLKRRLRT